METSAHNPPKLMAKGPSDLPKRVTRRNRPPTTEEKAGILAQIEETNQFLDILKDQFAKRSAAHDQAASKVTAATKDYEQANLRLKTTKDVSHVLAQTLKTLRELNGKNITSTPDPPNDNSPPAPSNQNLEDTAPQSIEPQLQGANDSPYIVSIHQTLQRPSSVESYIEVELEKNKKDMCNAFDTVSISHKKIQCAVALRSNEAIFLDYLQGHIGDMNTLLTTYHDQIRTIWYIPEEIW
jgi:hypothetical protein